VNDQYIALIGQEEFNKQLRDDRGRLIKMRWMGRKIGLKPIKPSKNASSTIYQQGTISIKEDNEIQGTA